MKKCLFALVLMISIMLVLSPVVLAADSITAKPISATVLVNGENVAFDAYNVNGNNYFKLRDLAYAFNGSEKQFEVAWDGAANAISLNSSQPYTAVGGEMQTADASEKTPKPTTSKILLDGREVSLTAYNIDGNNYFMLRDIGQAFDFGVDWDGARNTIVIDTSKGYMPEAAPPTEAAPAAETATGEMDLKNTIDNLPHPLAVAALWDKLEGYWNSTTDAACANFYYEQGAANFCAFIWESEGIPGGSMTEVQQAGEYIVNYTIHFKAMEADNMSDGRPARTVVYQVDFSYLANNENRVGIRNLTDNEEWRVFLYAGSTYDEAYESFLDSLR